jgi:hypothetical protein
MRKLVKSRLLIMRSKYKTNILKYLPPWWG